MIDSKTRSVAESDKVVAPKCEYDRSRVGDRIDYCIRSKIKDEYVFYKGMKTLYNPNFTNEKSRARKMSYGEAYGNSRNINRCGIEVEIVEW